MQNGGADVLELGIPFTDPQADGATIQKANEVALQYKVTLANCIDMVAAARAKGLTVPVVLMGYYNPFLAFGLDKLMDKCKAAGVDGFIVVDLPPEEGASFVTTASSRGLSYIPLVSPTSTNERINYLSTNAGSFLYCVSVTGVTGARGALPADLSAFVDRVRANSKAPLAIGFGISTPEHVKEVSGVAEGIVVGSAIIANIDSAPEQTPSGRIKNLQTFIASLKASIITKTNKVGNTKFLEAAPVPRDITNRNFGEFGGRYIPETLIDAHRELEAAYAEANKDPAFHAEIAKYRREFTGGPTPLYYAKNLSEKLGNYYVQFMTL